MPDRSVSELIRDLLRTRRTLLADVDLSPGASDRVLVRSDLRGTFQLYELASGELTELTSLPEPVATAEYVPGTRQAVLAIDAGGNERHQLYVLDLDGATASIVVGFDRLRALTSDPRYGHQSGGVSPDGRSLAYVSNRANGVDFDLWVCDIASGEHRLLYAGGSWLQPASGFSPDGRLVAVLRPGERPLDFDLMLVDVAHWRDTDTSGASRGSRDRRRPAWAGPSSFYVSSNVGSDFAAIVHHDLATATTTTLPGTGERFDAEVVTGEDGGTVMLIENRDGADVMQAIDPVTGDRGTPITLPEPGVTQLFFLVQPTLSADGSRVFYTLTTPRQAGDVYRCELATGETSRLTHSAAELGTR